MRADIVEFEWQRRLALNTIACSLSDLKCLAAEVRLERAIRRYGLALKYGYNPVQPRVPKGEDGAGQWTAEGGGNGSSGGGSGGTGGTTSPSGGVTSCNL